MDKLKMFKVAYILFLLLVVFVFFNSEETFLYATYLMFAALSLLSVMLHTVLSKLDDIEKHLTSATESS